MSRNQKKTVAAPAEPITESDAQQVVGGDDSPSPPSGQQCRASGCTCNYPLPPYCWCQGHSHN